MFRLRRKKRTEDQLSKALVRCPECGQRRLVYALRATSSLAGTRYACPQDGRLLVQTHAESPWKLRVEVPAGRLEFAED